MKYRRWGLVMVLALLTTTLFGSLYAQGIDTISSSISSSGSQVVQWTQGQPTWAPIAGTVGEMRAGGLIHVAVPVCDSGCTWTIAIYLKNPYALNEAYSFINMELHARKAVNGDMSVTPAWQATNAYSVGAIVQPTGTGNGHFYKCSMAGMSGATEPTWLTATGRTVVDGAATWTEFGPDTERAALIQVLGSTTALYPEVYDMLNPDTGWVAFSLDGVGGLAGIVETVGAEKTIKAIADATKATHRIFAIGIVEGCFQTRSVTNGSLSPVFFFAVRRR